MVADEASLRVLSTVMSPAFQHSNPTIYIRSSQKKHLAPTVAFYASMLVSLLQCFFPQTSHLN